MESQTRNFVFVDVNPKRSNSKHITQVVKSQARAYSHQQRIKREGGGGGRGRGNGGATSGAGSVAQKRQKRLLKPQQQASTAPPPAPAAVPAVVSAAAAAEEEATEQAFGKCPETDNALVASQHVIDSEMPISLLNILGGGRVDPFATLPLCPNNLPLRQYLDHWITVLAPAVCGLAPGETSQPSMQSVWMPLAYGDPTLLAATMFSSVAHIQLMQPEPGPEYFILKGKTLELIKSNLEDPEKAISDSNIAAVLCLARFGNYNKGGPIQHQPHKEVLRRMIDLRGGLENLGFHGILAKLIMLCDMLTATFEGTTSTFFPNQPPTPTYHSPYSLLRKFASSSPLLDCGDMEKVEAMPMRGREISDIVYELQDATTLFRTGNVAFIALGHEKNNATRNKCLELTIGVSIATLSQTICQSDKYVLGACLLAARIYRRAIVYGVPFADEINREPMRYLKVLIERIGIERTWALIPGILVWILLTGGAAAEGTPEKEYFVGLLVRIGMGIGLQNWDEFRISMLNFVWVQRELATRDTERVRSITPEFVHAKG